MQWLGRCCCAAGYDGRAAARPYRLEQVPIIIGKWYNLSAVLAKKIVSSCARGQSFVPGGEMAEWFNAHAWKACIPKRYRGFESPSLRHILQGNSDCDSQRDSQIPVVLGHDLSQVVTAWEKLPTPLKAAILAIVNSAEGQP